MVRCEAYSFFGWLFYVSSNIHSFRRHIEDNVCDKLRIVYLEGDVSWNEKWTSNISKSCDKIIQRIFE
jgi:hypothetical protein